MCRDYSLFNPNLRTFRFISDTCSCIIELYEKWFPFADFFRKLGFFSGFSSYIINICGRIGEAAMGWGDAQRPVLRVTRPKKTGARRARKLTRGQDPLVYKD